jgi:outer membrane lipoprotein carrier protein
VIGRTSDREIGRSGDRENTLLVHPTSGSPDHPIRGLSFTQSPDHPITRLAGSCSPDHPISRSPDWQALVVVFLFLVVTGSTVGNGSTDLLEEYVRQFESSYHAVRTIRADFTQTYVSGGRTRIESGVVYFARTGLMRWDYQRPQPKLFLSDGKTLMLYIPAEKQFTRSPLKASDDIRVPFRLLLSRLELRRIFSRLEFAPEALEHQAADRVLRAYPKKSFQGDYQQVLMVIGPQFDIRRLVVILPDQSTMEFSFDHIERNVPVSRSLFRFTPPPGTEVIEQR